MNSKPTDDSQIIEVPHEIAKVEETEGTSSESRSERIRRLNRERQRRRRMKLKMSRQSEPTMASEASSNVNMNLDNLGEFGNANTGHDRASIEVKVESEGADSGAVKARGTKGRSSRKKKQPSNIPSTVEATNQAVSDSANNAITDVCHGGQLATSSNELSEATDQLAVLVVASEIEVFGENPNVLNGAGEGENSQENVSGDTGEAKYFDVKPLIRSRTKREDGDEARTPRRKRSSTNSEEEIVFRREKQRELKRKQKEKMTPDQVEALRARYREWRRKRKEVMTSEQLEIIRRGNRERQRRRRERLGVRKRTGSSSSPKCGASEAVIQGIRNLHNQGRTASEGESKGSVSELMFASGLTVDDKTLTVMPVTPSSIMSSLPPSITTIVTQPVQATIPTNPNPQISTSNVATVPASYAQVQTPPQAISTIPVIGPQGALLPGMHAGAFFSGVTMPGMQVAGLQGAIFPGMPVPGSAAQAGIIQSSANQTITTIPMSGVPGIQTAQGGFLSGIPVTSTQGNVPQAYPNQIPFPREGQVLHNFQTLLPITPVQGSSTGMTFITPLPLTCGGQVQGVPDPKYTVATQGSQQVTQLVHVPVPVENQAEEPKTVEQPGQAKVKPKPRGRKRNTSAAEMLASLSSYVPSGNTPMASMLSALASSARDRQITSTSTSEEIPSESVQSKTVVLEATSNPSLPQGQKNPSPQTYNMYVTPPRVLDPYMARTVVSTMSTPSTIDVNCNNYTLAATSNGPSNIPHMNTFLTAIGGSQRPTGVQLSALQAMKVPGQQQVDIDKISVAVATDKIQKATKGTNTGEGIPVSLISVGTMTDSLYRSSVATNTDLAKASDVLQDNKLGEVEL